MKLLTKLLSAAISTILIFSIMSGMTISATEKPKDELLIFDAELYREDTACNFFINGASGVTVASYDKDDQTFKSVTVTIKLQKKFLLIFWTDVDEWTVTSYESSDGIYHAFDLNGSGTYKATFTITFTEIDGNTYTQTESIEAKLS